MIIVHDDPFRPQPRLDRDAEGGMATSVGRLRVDDAGLRYVLVSHNTKMGAAKGAVLTAEHSEREHYRKVIDDGEQRARAERHAEVVERGGAYGKIRTQAKVGDTLTKKQDVAPCLTAERDALEGRVALTEQAARGDQPGVPLRCRVRDFCEADRADDCG